MCVWHCQLQRLRAQQADLQEEVRNTKVDPAEMRERLFKKSKEDNDKLTRLQAVMKATEADNEQQRRVSGATAAGYLRNLLQHLQAHGRSSSCDPQHQRLMSNTAQHSTAQHRDTEILPHTHAHNLVNGYLPSLHLSPTLPTCAGRIFRPSRVGVWGLQIIAELDMDLEERKDESGDSQKYEKLYQRDREMSEFIDTFPAQKAKVRLRFVFSCELSNAQAACTRLRLVCPARRVAI